MGEEAHWQEILKQRGIPYAEIANKADLNRTVPDNAISISSIRDRCIYKKENAKMVDMR